MGGVVGAEGRAVGAVVVTRCDRSHRTECSGRMSSWVADLLAIVEEGSWRLERSS